MQREGGIFDATSALGIEVAMSDAITDMATCDFSGRTKNDGVALVQQILGEQGAKSLIQNGVWGQCSEDAFMQIFGNPTSQDTVQTFTGLTCGQFTPYGHDRPCVNGSDMPVPSASPPSTSKFVRSDLTRASSAIFNPFATPSTPVPSLPHPPAPGNTTAVTKSYTWLYVLAGLAVLGTAGYFLFWKKPAAKLAAKPAPVVAAAPNRRRRHHRRVPISILK